MKVVLIDCGMLAMCLAVACLGMVMVLVLWVGIKCVLRKGWEWFVGP